MVEEIRLGQLEGVADGLQRKIIGGDLRVVAQGEVGDRAQFAVHIQ